MISDRAGKCVSGSCCQLSGRACAIAVSKRVAIFVMIDLGFRFLENSIT